MGYAFADEAADRASIARVVSQLNRDPEPEGLFTTNADASVLGTLRSAGPVRVRVLSTPAYPNVLTVTISHEPWGEASIGPGAPAVEVLNPRIASGAIRFVTPDVALVDATFSYSSSTYSSSAGGPEVTPLLIVVKREGEIWKIDSVRQLSPSNH